MHAPRPHDTQNWRDPAARRSPGARRLGGDRRGSARKHTGPAQRWAGLPPPFSRKRMRRKPGPPAAAPVRAWHALPHIADLPVIRAATPAARRPGLIAANTWHTNYERPERRDKPP